MHLLDSIFKGSRFLTAAFLLFIPLFASSAENYFLNNEAGIIGERAVVKINEMGDELFQKSNISVYVSAKLTLDRLDVKEHVEELTKDLQTPYAVLIMVTNDKIIAIINSSDLDGKFDKEQILSPFPNHGSIKPLLTIKKDLDSYTAAILNGYADLVEQIAKNSGVTLQSAVGDTNKTTLDIIRLVVYSLFLIAALLYLYKRIRYRHAKKI